MRWTKDERWRVRVPLSATLKQKPALAGFFIPAFVMVMSEIWREAGGKSSSYSSSVQQFIHLKEQAHGRKEDDDEEEVKQEKRTDV